MDANETAGVAAFPPAIFAATVAAGLLCGRGTATDARSARFASVVGAASIAAGVGLVAAGAATLRRAGTNVSPYAPTTALVTAGPFAFTRNPLYVGLTAISVGIGLAARSLPTLAFVPIALALLDRGVVDREERYLAERFGGEYLAYRARVPRWF